MHNRVFLSVQDNRNRVKSLDDTIFGSIGMNRGARYYRYTGISRFRSPEIRIAICF